MPTTTEEYNESTASILKEMGEDISPTMLERAYFNEEFWKIYNGIKNKNPEIAWNTFCRKVNDNIKKININSEREKKDILNEFKIRFILKEFPEIKKYLDQERSNGTRFQSVSLALNNACKSIDTPFQGNTLIKISKKSHLEPLLVKLLFQENFLASMQAVVQPSNSKIAFSSMQGYANWIKTNQDAQCLYEYQTIIDSLLQQNDEGYTEFYGILTPILNNFIESIPVEKRDKGKEIIKTMYYTGGFCLFGHEQLINKLLSQLVTARNKLVISHR